MSHADTEWINNTSRNSEPVPPPPEEFQERLRANQKQYMAFADSMIRAVHGKSRYSETVSVKSFDTIISKSQEAFTLLLYENGYKNWLWTATNDPGSMSDTSGGGNTTDSNCPVYGYTSRNGENPPNRNGGWSTEGMLKFNELYRRVAADRAVDNGAFGRVYMAHRVSKFKSKKRQRRGRGVEEVTILDDLGDLQALSDPENNAAEV